MCRNHDLEDNLSDNIYEFRSHRPHVDAFDILLR
jgi:hypothetical protein